ncbi:MAG: S-layer homology domain-containing protein [Fusobacteriaceae bacterium]
MQKLKNILVIILIFPTLMYAANKYEDIPKEHWAYSSVNNLLAKGILKQDSYNFRGEEQISRYDFVYYLSKTLNKLDLEKTNKKDLLVLESLVSEFSKELTKMGFDTETFSSKIKNIDETIQFLKAIVEENQITIANLKKRVDILENKK